MASTYYIRKSPISAFTIVYDCIQRGIPIVETVSQFLKYVDEVVAIDLGSSDQTRSILKKLGVNVIEYDVINYEGFKSSYIPQAFQLNERCKNDLVLYFEPWEYFETTLMIELNDIVKNGGRNVSMFRTVIEQNFQRISHYPHIVHRLFRRGGVDLRGSTTNKTHLKRMTTILPNYGFIWACRHCFIDNWKLYVYERLSQERMVVIQNSQGTIANVRNKNDVDRVIKQPHWYYTKTILKTPPGLDHLIGASFYTPHMNRFESNHSYRLILDGRYIGPYCPQKQLQVGDTIQVPGIDNEGCQFTTLCGKIVRIYAGELTVESI